MQTRLTLFVRRLRSSGWLSLLLFALVLFSVRSAVADWYDVPSESMLPTLEVGDRIAVDKLAYAAKLPFTGIELGRWGSPERGDVVTLPSPVDGKRLVKRVCAIAGDLVEMRDGRLILNGTPVAYESVGRDGWREGIGSRGHAVQFDGTSLSMRDFGPVRVPEGAVLVLGDNRDNSADSRAFGFATARSVEGRVRGVAFSLDHDRYYRPRSDRWFRSID